MLNAEKMLVELALKTLAETKATLNERRTACIATDDWEAFERAYHDVASVMRTLKPLLED